jgi:ornithine carbamoyltransferase
MNAISLQNFSAEEIRSIIETSMQIKKEPFKYEKLLEHKKLYMLFQKTSTRTSLSSGLGFSELGGTYFIQKWEDSNFTVGEMVDETRYVATNVDIILARLKRNQDIQEMGNVSPVPVINGCCDKYHPLQGLADCMTIKELFGTYKKTVLYVGIWNNVFNSLINSIPKLGGTLIGFCPIFNPASISGQEAEDLAETTENLTIFFGADASVDKLKKLVNEADVVYSDTWVDMEFFHNPAYRKQKEERIELMKPFALTSELLKFSQAKVLHDMPMHEGYEIDRDLIEAHIETILQQGENRRHVIKGLFAYLLGTPL